MLKTCINHFYPYQPCTIRPALTGRDLETRGKRLESKASPFDWCDISSVEYGRLAVSSLPLANVTLSVTASPVPASHEHLRGGARWLLVSYFQPTNRPQFCYERHVLIRCSENDQINNLIPHGFAYYPFKRIANTRMVAQI